MVVARNVRKMMAIDPWAKPRRSVIKHRETMSRDSRPSRDQSFACIKPTSYPPEPSEEFFSNLHGKLREEAFDRMTGVL